VRHGGRSAGTCCCPDAKPGLVAFAIVSITAHWNAFLWPLMVAQPRNQTLTIRQASFRDGRRVGKEMGRAWPPHASRPWLRGRCVFVAFQRASRQLLSFQWSGKARMVLFTNLTRFGIGALALTFRRLPH